MQVDFLQVREDLYILTAKNGDFTVNKIFIEAPAEMYTFFNDLKEKASSFDLGFKIQINND